MVYWDAYIISVSILDLDIELCIWLVNEGLMNDQSVSPVKDCEVTVHSAASILRF